MSDSKDLSFSKLREDYSEFVYKGYSVIEIPGAFHVEYDMEIPGLSEFKARWDFPFAALSSDGSNNIRHIDKDNDEILGELIFALGMVECISYYKITCPKVFRIECHKLDDKQIMWWRKLIYNGLGEFMYRNGIDVTEEELVNIICKPGEEYAKVSGEKAEPLHDKYSYDGFLVPVGGGKDSVVSLELLKGKDIVTYTVNGNATTKAVIDICTHKSGDYTAKRVLDKRMLDLNAEGYLNGHTPFSAIIAFSSVITAYLTGKKYIVLSNENSANETTVKDSFVNHQYSKSYEFEKDFEEYFKNITDSYIHYFSMLRPLTELQIAALFAKDKEYHKVFRSCNVGSKQGIWCCDCPKCLFVYIILSPFLSEKELKDIFGEKLLDKESLDKDFRELVGIEENKPFECVGTRREVVSCMKYCRKKGLKSLLTDRYADYIDQNGDDLDLMLKEWNEIHNVPEELKQTVHDAVKFAGPDQL